jgi:Predicted divalent heavy-metal cations transporter
METIVLVFLAGLVTAIATGLGALPFFFIDDFSDRWNVGLWGVASGIMVTVSVFGLVDEGIAHAAGGVSVLSIAGLLAGVVLVEVGDRLLDRIDVGGTDDRGPRDAHGWDDGSGSRHPRQRGPSECGCPRCPRLDSRRLPARRLSSSN